jgi:transcriptional regulator with XRE-family HTH domain
MSFADKLNRLFDTVHPPGRRPYTSAEVVAGLRANGTPMSAPYLSQLRSGNRDNNPSTATVVALANFFGIDPAYFTDDKYAEQLDEKLDALAQLRGRGKNVDESMYTGRHRAAEPSDHGAPVARDSLPERGRAEDAHAGELTAEADGSASYQTPSSVSPSTESRPLQRDIVSLRTAETPPPVVSPVRDAAEIGPILSEAHASMSRSGLQGSRKVDAERQARPSADRCEDDQHRQPIVDRGSRLFKFLAEVQNLKIPRITDLQTYKDDGEVLWFADVPEHDQVLLEFRDGRSNSFDAILTVNRIVGEQPPAAPAELKPWIDGGSADPGKPPSLRMSIPTGERTADGDEIVTRLEDHPEVQSGFDAWRRQWDDWAERTRQDEPVIDLYRTLFSSFRRLSDHPEEFELVVAVGCLGWAPPGGTVVRRHLLTCPAEITFDDSTATIVVQLRPHVENIKVELDMLAPGQVSAPDHVNSVRDDARNFEHHLLDRDASGGLLRRLIYSVDAAGRCADSDSEPECAQTPEVTFAPAIVMRKRSRLGFRLIFEKIQREIAETGEVPSGLLPLVDPDFEPRSEPAAAEGALVQVDEEVLSPLPLNAVQLDILRAVDRRAQTVVQGPPGTGKTHTLRHSYAAPRTSILPVTASVISADRYSCNVSIERSQWSIKLLILADFPSSKWTIASCSSRGGMSAFKCR